VGEDSIKHLRLTRDIVLVNHGESTNECSKSKHKSKDS